MSTEYSQDIIETSVSLSLRLGEADVELIDSTSRFIEAGIPDRDMIGMVTAFVTKNAKLQDKLSNLLFGLRNVESLQRIKMYQRESLLRPDYASEGFRSASERDVMLYRDSKFRDIRERVTFVSNLIARIEELSWILKSMLKAVGG